MGTLYIVSECGWEYDDNNYYPSEGSYPSRAFRTKQRAIEEAERMSLERFKNYFNELREYPEPFDISAADESEIFQKLFECSAEEWFCDYNADFVVKPTEEDWKQLYDCCQISWYSVAEIEVEEDE